ncbi:MAG: fasciclin domain-containing protein, partial [Balneolaceae bacterium]|nr:fasciclin domain-containing protein [Balneolaceae bacterium]
IILNHMITGLATKRKLKMMNNIPTLGGIHLKMKSTNGDLQINKAVVIQANIKASNGVIHIVDELLQ